MKNKMHQTAYFAANLSTATQSQPLERAASKTARTAVTGSGEAVYETTRAN